MNDQKTAAENFESLRAALLSMPTPPAWELLREKIDRASADLHRAIDEYGSSLPPGSMVAVQHKPVEMLPIDGVLRVEYTLRPVFPGHPMPGPEWMVYAKHEGPEERRLRALGIDPA